MTALNIKDIFSAMSMLPQITTALKKMTPEEKVNFVEQLGIGENMEKEAALNLINAFQEGRPLTADEQKAAQQMLDKVLNMQGLDLFSIFNAGQKR